MSQRHVLCRYEYSTHKIIAAITSGTHKEVENPLEQVDDIDN